MAEATPPVVPPVVTPPAPPAPKPVVTDVERKARNTARKELRAMHKVDRKHPKFDPKSFDDVKGELETRLKPDQTQKAVSKAIQDLEKTNPPTLDPEFFGPDKPPAPPSLDKK